MKVNRHYLELKESYLFSTVARKAREYQQNHPGVDIIRLSIGDVTLPLAPVVVAAMEKAAGEMGVRETFRGYGEEQGYEFLRTAICRYYAAKGVSLRENEVFVSDGAKSDLGNILDIFSTENTVLVPDPVYPVYVDTNIMAGRKILFSDANEANGFLPLPDENGERADIIYLCSPNNPTGAVYGYDALKQWVDYARRTGAVILFDAAYEAFVTDPALPTSIYQIEGARECAIEFCSFSKTAGFTGTRCGYTVVPEELERDGVRLNRLWLRRQTTKFNGVSYIVQRGAEAVFTDEGMKQIRESIGYYRENARLIRFTLDELGVRCVGGENSPYIWMRCPGGQTSWEFFDELLDQAHVVGTPGSGFGRNGEGYFRLTAFGNRENTAVAMQRISALLKK